MLVLPKHKFSARAPSLDFPFNYLQGRHENESEAPAYGKETEGYLLVNNGPHFMLPPSGNGFDSIIEEHWLIFSSGPQGTLGIKWKQ